jgi:p24 family protein alpha
VVSQRGSSSGRFTFSAADAGEHRICFTPSSSSGRQGWLSVLHPNGGIKLSLDLAIGETSDIESSDKGKMADISQRVRDLNSRLQDIRREQVFQRVCVPFDSIHNLILDNSSTRYQSGVRPCIANKDDLQEREAEFRDQSETTNARVVRWMFIQVIVLGATCAWQLSHLRSFFIKQKLT